MFRSALCAGALLFLLAGAAAADVRYTTQMLMDMGGQEQPMMTMTTQIKGQRERVDMQMSMGPMQMQRTQLTMCDQHLKADINATARIFTLSPIEPLANMMSPMQAMKRPPKEHASGTGTVTTTITVEDKGTEQVGQFNAHHYIVNMQMQTTGCAGNDNTTMKSEMWVAPVSVGFNCPERSAPQGAVENGGCRITYVTKGDTAKFAEIQGGLIVQRKFFEQGSTFIQRVTSYSTASLNDADFKIPGDFKQVSQSDFEKAAMKAMQENMRNMQKGQ